MNVIARLEYELAYYDSAVHRFNVIGLVDCTGSAAVVGWIPRLLLRLVVRTHAPRFAAWFGVEDADPMLLGEVTDSSLPGTGS